MDYKLFPLESPSDAFINQLKAFCALDDVQREALAAWFQSTSDFNTYTPEAPPIIQASTLLPEQFRKVASPIRFILDVWHRRSLEVADIERDLLLCGFSTEEIKLVTGFIERLAPIREKVWIDGLEGHAQYAGLPTIDDANIVWDARAVFGGPAYYYFSDIDDDARYEECFGVTSIAILELMVSDSSGNKERFSVQMNEMTFKIFLRAMNRADRQLASLKALTGSITVGQESLKG